MTENETYIGIDRGKGRDWQKKIILKEVNGEWVCKFVSIDSQRFPITLRDLKFVHRTIKIESRNYQRNLILKQKEVKDESGK